MKQLDLFSSIEQELTQQEEHLPELKSEKLYHSITEVAKALNVNASLLRFWEKEFSQLNPRKNGKGDRLYTKQDIKLINTILYLTREKKFTLEGCRAFLKRDAQSAGKEQLIVEELKMLKHFLQNLKKSL